MSLFRRAVAGVPARRALTGDPWSIPSNGSLSSFSSTGIQVDEGSALQLLSVTACVRLISETLSGLPFDVVTGTGATRETMEPPPPIVADPFGGANSVSGFGLTRKSGLGQVLVSLLLRGNAYLYVVSRDRFGVPTWLQVLSPDAVVVKLNGKTGAREYLVNGTPMAAENLLHIMGMTLPGQPTGLSVISYAKRSIGLGIAAEEFGSRFFGNGAHLSGVIEVPGDLDRDKARRLKESFEASHGGLGKSHQMGVLTGGASFKPVSVSPEDAQFLGTRSAQTSDIAMLFGVPPHMLGQVDRTTSWGKGIEEQTLGFLKYTLQSWVSRIEDAWSAMLPEGQVARFNLDSLLRADSTTRYAAYMAARNAAFMTPNEIRALENLPPVDGGDDLYAPLNSAHTTDPGFQPGQDEPDDPEAGTVDNSQGNTPNV